MTWGQPGGQDEVDTSADRGTTFDGVTVGRPARGALADAGYTSLADLPDDLSLLLRLHGVGPSAVGRLAAARAEAGLSGGPGS
jgi:hypothetical protein